MDMENNNKGKVNRRSFLRMAGAGSVATAAALYGCKPDNRVTAPGGSVGEVPADEMTYRINPTSGDKVSLLGYGCMRFPLRKNDKGEEEIDQEIANELVDYAIAHGVNFFDTSPVYIRGWSEAATGIALKRHPRDKFFIATKLSNMSNTPYMRSFEGSVAMYHKSFKDLQVDYIDYYLLHTVGSGGMENFNNRYVNNGVLDFLLKEREAGRIRNLGFSFHGDIAVYDYLLSSDIQWDFVYIQMNYIDWRNVQSERNTNAEYLLGELEKRNIPAVVMEPLLGGRLARVSPQALHLMKEMHPEDTAAKWAFRYAGTPESILSVLSGMVYMEHLQENVKTYSPLEPLNKEEYQLLDKVTRILLNDTFVECTECQYCMPCPYGLDIPAIFGHYNRVLSAGNVLISSKDEGYKEARRAFLVGYDRSVPKLRQANRCIGCNLCLSHCPQLIDIPEEMRRIDVYVELLKQKKEF